MRDFIRNTAANETAAESLLLGLDDRRLGQLLSKAKQSGHQLETEDRVALMRFLTLFLYARYEPGALNPVLVGVRSTVIDLLEQNADRRPRDGRWIVMQRVL